MTKREKSGMTKNKKGHGDDKGWHGDDTLLPVIPDLIGDPEERRHIIIVRASGRKELRVTGFPLSRE